MLHIEEVILNELITNVESSQEECCGFLFGNETGDDRTIAAIMSAENVSKFDKRIRFEISPVDYIKAEKFADQNNLHLLGIYHSHPNSPAVPSVFDRAAAQPHFSYAILSVFHNKFSAIRSWRLTNSLQFEEEKIDIYKIHQSNTINGNRIHSNTAA